MLLGFDENGDLDERNLNLDDNEKLESHHHLFLTKTLGWKEGLHNYEPTSCPQEMNEANVNTLAVYLFLTEQMNWKKGLTVFQERRGEEAIMKELQQIHDIEGFVPKQRYELTIKRNARGR